MNIAAEQALAPEIGRGDRLLWGGIPRQGFFLRPGDALLIPFSLLWCGFVFFWQYQVFKQGQTVMILWGLPFILAGLYATIGRFIADVLLRARTYYGITEQRAIIVTGLFSRTVKSLSLQSLSEISFKERSDRSGIIMFGSGNPAYVLWFGTNFAVMGQKPPAAFDLIEDVRRVFDLIRETQENGSGRYGV